jgi:hypothetical protein
MEPAPKEASRQPESAVMLSGRTRVAGKLVGRDPKDIAHMPMH